MKKISLSCIALAFALVIPFSTADASSGWDYLGKENFYYNSYYDWWDTPNVYSTGGDFKIANNCLGYTYVELWESDPGSGNDDYVASRRLFGGHTRPYRGIGGYVDGSNNRAEFYVRTHNSSTARCHIFFYD